MLKFKVIGEGEPLFILHGLFGTMDNWRTMAKMLDPRFQLILVDLRNHGRSFWAAQHSYDLMAEDICEVMDHLQIDKAHLLGHSMGGKVVLTFARRFPDRTNRIIVVDIAPKEYKPGHLDIFNGVLSLDLNKFSTRKEVDNVLALRIKNVGVRQFLLKSLDRNANLEFSWKTNFRALYENYVQILKAISIEGIESPTLFIRGLQSTYISNEDIAMIKNQIAHVEFVDIDSGHWVHAERPKELLDRILTFLIK